MNFKANKQWCVKVNKELCQWLLGNIDRVHSVWHIAYNQIEFHITIPSLTTYVSIFLIFARTLDLEEKGDVLISWDFVKKYCRWSKLDKNFDILLRENTNCFVWRKKHKMEGLSGMFHFILRGSNGLYLGHKINLPYFLL